MNDLLQEVKFVGDRIIESINFFNSINIRKIPAPLKYRKLKSGHKLFSTAIRNDCFLKKKESAVLNMYSSEYEYICLNNQFKGSFSDITTTPSVVKYNDFDTYTEEWVFQESLVQDFLKLKLLLLFSYLEKFDIKHCILYYRNIDLVLTLLKYDKKFVQDAKKRINEFFDAKAVRSKIP